jgi:hypothetical protein
VPVPDLDSIVGGQRHDGLATLDLTATSQQVLEEGERATTRRGDDLAAIGIHNREWPVLSDGLGKDRTEAPPGRRR